MSIAAACIASVGVLSALIALLDQLQGSFLSIRPDTLGDYMNSPLAVVFNLSLLAAGACFFFCAMAIYYTFEDPFSRAIALVGAMVGFSIALLGIFPINYLDWHRKVSTIYLLCSALLHFLSILNYFRPKNTMTRAEFGLSLLSLIMSLSLIFMLDWRVLDFPPCNESFDHFCWVATCMWGLTQANILWCVCLGFGMRRYIVLQQKDARQLTPAY
ncbi:DUF998 domain-containing protein [Shewanella aestuarii]|uniref:DUF998 domain-containing protein n=1 Tax=Shewanella aestuarii TaxID=1028752 RepID=A0A6G9QI53_9GAMM|nr:DUF998 domain-containing protein [Shewanella aestuarii]QIR13559.1 DUF998 domain-containing protein [Shewanella aestuarii]